MMIIDAGVQKKIYGSQTTTLIISNQEMNETCPSFRKFMRFVERSY